jgi:hypothetical protein
MEDNFDGGLEGPPGYDDTFMMNDDMNEDMSNTNGQSAINVEYDPEADEKKEL